MSLRADSDMDRHATARLAMTKVEMTRCNHTPRLLKEGTENDW